MVFIVAPTMNLLAVLVSTWLLAAPGKPPSPEEQRLFDEGMRAFQAGNARDADKAWRAGYQIGKDPAFLVRMGEAEEKAGLTAEAGESYRRYLSAAPTAADRAEIEQRLARLGPAGAAATTMPDTPGVPGAFGGSEPPVSPPAAAGPPAAPSPPSPPAVAPALDEESERRGEAEGDSTGWGPLNITAWVATGATVLLLGVSAYFAASAGSSKDDANLLLRYQDPMTGAPLEYQTVAARYEKAIHDGQHDDRMAKGALIAAAGTTVVATVFFILDTVRTPGAPVTDRRQARAPRGPRVGLSLSPEGGQTSALTSLRWSF